MVEKITAVPTNPHRILETGNTTEFDPFHPLNAVTDITYRTRECEWMEIFIGHYEAPPQDRESAGDIFFHRTTHITPIYNFQFFLHRNREGILGDEPTRVIDSSQNSAEGLLRKSSITGRAEMRRGSQQPRH